MYMDEYEITQSYLQAKDRKAQVRILAELNLTSKQAIMDVLARRGAAQKEQFAPKEETRMLLYRLGLNDREIAERLGVDRQIILLWRRKNNLTANC